MQTVNELKYSQSVWGFQPRKAEIRKVCDVKGQFRGRNHLDVCKDRFKQRCQIVPLVRRTLKCPVCGTEILLASHGRTRYVQGLPNGKPLTFFGSPFTGAGATAARSRSTSRSRSSRRRRPGSRRLWSS